GGEYGTPEVVMEAEGSSVEQASHSHDEAGEGCNSEHLRPGQAQSDARPEEGGSDRREHLAGGPASTDSGATRRRSVRPGGRVAPPGSVQTAGRRDHSRLPCPGAATLILLDVPL